MTPPRFRRVAAGDYETNDGRARLYRLLDVLPLAWNVDVDLGDGPGRFESPWRTVVDEAATKRDALSLFADWHKGAALENPPSEGRPTVNATTNPRAIGYLRVSTRGQADYGMGLNVQRERVRAYAKEHGLDLIEVVQESASGAVKDGAMFSHEHRPILSELLERSSVGRPDGGGRNEAFDVLLVASFDRLSRDQLSLVFIKRLLRANGVEAVSTIDEEANGNGDAIGELLGTIIGAIHDYERKRILERLAAGRQAKRSEGRLIAGFAPYGYRQVKRSRATARAGTEKAPDAGKLEPDEPPSEADRSELDPAAVVRRIFREARRGSTPGRIAAGLNADGIPSPARQRAPRTGTTRGETWNRTTVRTMIENRTYRGELHSVKGAHEAIVSPALWNAANAALRSRTRPR